MSYTLEQKQAAVSRMDLWWRFPAAKDYYAGQWTKVSTDLLTVDLGDLQATGAEYFIGPTPPRVLSELEGELLEALKGVLAEFNEQTGKGMVHDEFMACVKARAAIQKAEVPQ